MSRRWFKIWIEEWETGSIRVDMDSAERGFWLDMISKSLKGRIDGKICRDSKGEIGYTNAELAEGARVPLSLVESTIAKRLKDKSIILHPNNVIEIANIWKFQSKMDKSKNGSGQSIDNTVGQSSRRTQTSKEISAAKASVYFVNQAWSLCLEGKNGEADVLLKQAVGISPAARQQWMDLWLRECKRLDKNRIRVRKCKCNICGDVFKVEIGNDEIHSIAGDVIIDLTCERCVNKIEEN